MVCSPEEGEANQVRSALCPCWNSRLSSGMQPHPAAVSDGAALKHCSAPWRCKAPVGTKSRSPSAALKLLLKVLNSTDGLAVRKPCVFDVRGG